jgi:DNA-binding response OmpR family regulator
VLSPGGPGEFPTMVVVARPDIDRFPWAQVADEFVHSGTSAPELRVRLAMMARRIGEGSEATLRLGPVAINTDTYQVAVAGRVLDLTYKEFELLRFLIQRPERVFTRTELLSEVWGYDFYGGTRTVDVHVRRLRAKLGPEHEALVETVRSVGYRAAEPGG